MAIKIHIVFLQFRVGPNIFGTDMWLSQDKANLSDLCKLQLIQNFLNQTKNIWNPERIVRKLGIISQNLWDKSTTTPWGISCIMEKIFQSQNISSQENWIVKLEWNQSISEYMDSMMRYGFHHNNNFFFFLNIYVKVI